MKTPVLFLLTIIADSVLANGGCSVCGTGKIVAKPEAIFSFPHQPAVPCGILEQAGRDGEIHPKHCSILSSLIKDVCECIEGSSPTTPPSTDSIADDETNYHCSICGRGRVIADYEAMVSLPNQSAIKCDLLQKSGYDGDISFDECASLQPMVEDVCDCVGFIRPSNNEEIIFIQDEPTSPILTPSPTPGDIIHEENFVSPRFNKFDKQTRAENYPPLNEGHYPISKNLDMVTMLRYDTNAISVIDDRDDRELKHSVAELIESVGGLPDHPSNNKNAAYWDKLGKVCEMREITIANLEKPAKNILANIMHLPQRWKDYTMNDVAEAVHDEYPGQHQAEFIFDLLNGHYGRVQVDETIIPRRASAQFLHGIVMLADLNTWSVSNVGPYNFGAKWFAGRARPEEVAWKIKTGELEIVPQWIKTKIDNFPDFTKPEKFTNYQEGSPRHPSWPAMHSAASNISFWIQIVMRLTPNQLCEAKKVDYAVAYARTIAGVHYEDDNIAGLDMGQEIVARDLPGYLEKRYGTDTERTKRKMKYKRFKWEYYDPLEAC